MQAISQALDAIYAAALDVSEWPLALQKIADCFDDIGTVLLFLREDGTIGTITSPSLADAQRDYDAKWRAQDLRTIRAFERGFLLRSDAATDRHLVTAEEMTTHPIYTEFLAKHGLGWFAGICVLPSPRNAVWFSIQRSKAKPEFSDEELGLLTILGKHAENSLRLGIRLLNAEATSRSLTELLASLDYGVLLLDDNGRVVYRNAAMDGLNADGVSTHTVVKESLWHIQDMATSASIYSSLHEAPNGSRFALYTLPIKSTASNEPAAFFQEARTIVLIRNIDKKEPLDPTLVRDLLGLTLAEARVASLIGAGMAPKAIANTLAIAEDTARKALKSVFSKTLVNRQTELALLLSRLISKSSL